MSEIRLSNYILGISCNQFMRLAQVFKRQAEINYDTPCEMTLSLFDNHKLETDSKDEDLQKYVADRNFENRFYIGPVVPLPNLWHRAVYAEITVEPLDPTKARPDAYAHAEFKGILPNSASFTVCPGKLSNGYLRVAIPRMHPCIFHKKHTKIISKTDLNSDHGKLINVMYPYPGYPSSTLPY